MFGTADSLMLTQYV